MLQGTVRVNLDETCLRIDPVQYIPAVRRLVETDEQLAELEAYLGEPLDELAPIADRRFESFEGGFRAGRYNSVKFPAFYISRDEQSARGEVLHYQTPDKLAALLKISSPVFLGITFWRVECSGEDITLAKTDEPRLTDDDWAYCQSIGEDIRTRNDAAVVPSARVLDGTHVVVFRRPRVRGQGRGREVRLSLNAQGLVEFLD